MFTKSDIATLRANGTTDREILSMTARILPGASKALRDIDADKTTPDMEKNKIMRQMIDKNAKSSGPSMIPYVSALTVNTATKKSDALDAAYKAQEQNIKQQNPFSPFAKGETTLAQRLQAALPKEGSLMDYATAPGRAATGLINRGVGNALQAVGAENVGGAFLGTNESQNLGQNLEMAGETARVVLPVAAAIGSGGASLGVQSLVGGIAGATGQLSEDLGDVANGTQDKSALGIAGSALAAGALNAGLTYGVGKAAQLIKGKPVASRIEELVQPKATSKLVQETAEKSPELVKKGGILTKGKLLPSKSEQALAETARSIKGFGETDDIVQNMNLARSQIETDAQALRASLQSNTAALPRKEISSAISKAQQEAVSAFGNEQTAVRQYQGIVNMWKKVSEKFPGTNVGQWDARIAFDQELERQFGKKVFDPTLERPIHAAVKAVREAANETIEKASRGAGRSFVAELKKMSQMYQILENMKTKVGQDTLKSGAQKFLESRSGRAAAGVAAGAAAVPLGVNLLSQ